KYFNQFYFLTPPDQMVFFNLPTDSKWQLLDKPLSKAEFDQTPEINFLLFQFRVSGQDVRNRLNEKGFDGFVNLGDLNGRSITVHEAPLERRLQAGMKYLFRIESSDYSEIAIVNKGEYQILRRAQNAFEIEITAGAGDLTVGGKTTEGGKEVLHGM